jgi:hypothetical protein
MSRCNSFRYKFKEQRMARALGVVVLLAISVLASTPKQLLSQGYVVLPKADSQGNIDNLQRGSVQTKPDLEIQIARWKLRLFKRLSRGDKNTYYGAFAWCVNREINAFIFGYSYDEVSEARAEKKAILQLESRGHCAKTPTIIRDKAPGTKD